MLSASRILLFVFFPISFSGSSPGPSSSIPISAGAGRRVVRVGTAPGRPRCSWPCDGQAGPPWEWLLHSQTPGSDGQGKQQAGAGPGGPLPRQRWCLSEDSACCLGTLCALASGEGLHCPPPGPGPRSTAPPGRQAALGLTREGVRACLPGTGAGETRRQAGRAAAGPERRARCVFAVLVRKLC